jgi:predicted nucleic acid-binding protein
MRLLDTSVLAKWGDPTQKETVVPYLKNHADEQFVASSLVVFEFFRPAKRRTNSGQVRAWLQTVLDDIEPFDEDAGMAAARVEANLQQHGASLPMRDLLLASHARALSGTFVTYDKGDFADPVVQELLDVDVIEP